MNSEFKVDVYKTGIQTLDEMLDGGLPQESTVLITGRPGTGKTTLGLQILAEAAKKKLPTAFLTFEESPAKAFKNFYKSYGCGLNDNDYVHTDKVGQRFPKTKKFIRIISKPDDWLVPLELRDRHSKKDSKPNLERLFRQLGDCGIWFIDGVNVLLERLPEQEGLFLAARSLQQQIRRVFIDESLTPKQMKVHPARPNIVIMTAEASTDRREYIYESYLADVVIKLKHRDFAPDANFPNTKERHLVCSVPKGRGIHVQRREVTYEFVPSKGIKFYPTYPASGTVSFLSLIHI